MDKIVDLDAVMRSQTELANMLGLARTRKRLYANFLEWLGRNVGHVNAGIWLLDCNEEPTLEILVQSTCSVSEDLQGAIEECMVTPLLLGAGDFVHISADDSIPGLEGL